MTPDKNAALVSRVSPPTGLVKVHNLDHSNLLEMKKDSAVDESDLICLSESNQLSFPSNVPAGQ